MDGKGCLGGCGCMLALVAVAMLWGGSQGLYTYLNNPEPVEMSCAEYAEKRPEGEWVKLSECEYWLDEAVIIGMPKGFGDTGKSEEFATVDDVYVPLRPKGQPIGESTPLVMASNDGELESRITKVALSDTPDRVLREHPEWGTETITVEGTIQYGIELSEEDRKDVERLSDDLDENFVVVDRGKKPDLQVSLSMTIAGVVLSLLLGGGVFFFAVREAA